MGFHLSPSNYDASWTCSECSKPIAAIAGKFKIYNRRQLTCSEACALARKTRRQAERRATKAAAAWGSSSIGSFMPSPDASKAARRREVYRRTGKA
ncbi:MAG TPA: hypothetical protein VEB22_11315 [Phycisphaerales bacterium]|nr:hypothetical protein [Phycisphaerales bacterium]